MKIAVTFENGQVFQHFGHCAEFKVYNVEDGKIVSSEVISSDGQGHGALATLLGNNDIDTLICGGIGGGARQALAEVGIDLYPGVTGEADAAVEALLNDTLDYDPNTTCNHHGHGHEHAHGEGHTCAHGKCGK